MADMSYTVNPKPNYNNNRCWGVGIDGIPFRYQTKDGRTQIPINGIIKSASDVTKTGQISYTLQPEFKRYVTVTGTNGVLRIRVYYASFLPTASPATYLDDYRIFMFRFEEPQYEQYMSIPYGMPG